MNIYTTNRSSYIVKFGHLFSVILTSLTLTPCYPAKPPPTLLVKFLFFSELKKMNSELSKVRFELLQQKTDRKEFMEKEIEVRLDREILNNGQACSGDPKSRLVRYFFLYWCYSLSIENYDSVEE